MLADPEINVVMIAGGYRCCDCVDYRNRNTTFLYGLSCGAAAAILRKGHPRNEVLESAILCDGSYSLDLIPLVGGTVEPATPETVGGPRTKFDAPNLEEMKRRLNEESVRNFMRVIDTALHKSGYSRADVNYLAMVHNKMNLDSPKRTPITWRTTRTPESRTSLYRSNWVRSAVGSRTEMSPC